MKSRRASQRSPEPSDPAPLTSSFPSARPPGGAFPTLPIQAPPLAKRGKAGREPGSPPRDAIPGSGIAQVK